MEMTIVNLAGSAVDGSLATVLPAFGAAARPRATGAVAGYALGDRGFGFCTAGIRLMQTPDPTLDVTPALTS